MRATRSFGLSLAVLLAAACGDTGGSDSVIDGVDAGGVGGSGAGGEGSGGNGTGGNGTGGVGSGGNGGGVGPFCDVVAQVFNACTTCHKPGGNYPDLVGEAAAAVVGLNSLAHAERPLVVAGDPAASLLYRKVAGTMAADEGALMPQTGMLAEGRIAVLRTWIEAGAPTTCEDPVVPTGGTMGGDYHPPGYDAAAVHGLELKTGAQDCRECHGATLEGGSGPSCDSCHEDGWRTNCTYCHGGTDGENGAPPRDLRGATVRDELTFRAHTEHTTERNHIAWDCDQCHIKPLDVLSEGHIFDATAGKSEVDFSGGLSPAGEYDGNGGCSNLYCHGTGRAYGAIEHTAARPSCSGCHTAPPRTGEHGQHSREGIACDQCHSETAQGSNAIGNVANHVNGTIDVAIAVAGFTFQAGTCTGSCHGENHRGRRW